MPTVVQDMSLSWLLWLCCCPWLVCEAATWAYIGNGYCGSGRNLLARAGRTHLGQDGCKQECEARFGCTMVIYDTDGNCYLYDHTNRATISSCDSNRNGYTWWKGTDPTTDGCAAGGANFQVRNCKQCSYLALRSEKGTDMQSCQTRKYSISQTNTAGWSICGGADVPLVSMLGFSFEVCGSRSSETQVATEREFSIDCSSQRSLLGCLNGVEIQIKVDGEWKNFLSYDPPAYHISQSGTCPYDACSQSPEQVATAQDMSSSGAVCAPFTKGGFSFAVLAIVSLLRRF